jgi:hypothetical protein
MIGGLYGGRVFEKRILLYCWEQRRYHQKEPEDTQNESGFMFPRRKSRYTAGAAAFAPLGGRESMEKKACSITPRRKRLRDKDSPPERFS